MSILRRYLGDCREFWWGWLPLLLISVLLPLSNLAMPLVEKRLIDDVLLAKQAQLLPRTLLIYAGLWMFSVAILVVAVTLRIYVTERLTMRFRQRLFVHCEALSVDFSRREHSGRTLSLFLNDVPNMTTVFTTVIGGLACSLSWW